MTRLAFARVIRHSLIWAFVLRAECSVLLSESCTTRGFVLFCCAGFGFATCPGDTVQPYLGLYPPGRMPVLLSEDRAALGFVLSCYAGFQKSSSAAENLPGISKGCEQP